MMKRYLFALCCVLWAVTCYAQTAIRPDQISPKTPDITWGPGGSGYQIGTTVAWRTNATATSSPPDFSSADVGMIVELTFAGPITKVLPDASIANNLGDGAGFTIQVGPGSLTLNANRASGGASTINGLASLTVGPYQQVGLLSRSTNWYANLSVPQPATQAGVNVLRDNMTWQAAGTAPGITLGNHAVGAAAAAGATSSSVVVTSVVAGQVVTGEYFYCQNSACNAGAAALAPTSITGTRGETCTDLTAARAWIGSGGSWFGSGAFVCTGTTGTTANDTLTVTMPTDASYLAVYGQAWNGASGVDSGCTNKVTQTSSLTTWTITSGTATVANTVPVSLVAPISSSSSATTTNGTVIDDDTKGRITSRLPVQVATGTYTMNGNNSPGSPNVASILCVKP